MSMARDMHGQPAAYECAYEDDEDGADSQSESSVKFIVIRTGDRHSIV
jgi:hypothetical protein